MSFAFKASEDDRSSYVFPDGSKYKSEDNEILNLVLEEKVISLYKEKSHAGNNDCG